MNLGGVKGSFGQVVIHPTAYDACLEIAAMQQGMWVMGTSNTEMHYKSSRDRLKNHLLEGQCHKTGL